MAEHILRRSLASAGLDGEVGVASAGLIASGIGGPADPRAVAALAEGGYSSQHAVRQVGRDLVVGSDLVIALTRWHEDALRHLAAGWGIDRDIRLLRSFDPAADSPDVPDPIGGDAGTYLRVRGLIEGAMPGIVAAIQTTIR